MTITRTRTGTLDTALVRAWCRADAADDALLAELAKGVAFAAEEAFGVVLVEQSVSIAFTPSDLDRHGGRSLRLPLVPDSVASVVVKDETGATVMVPSADYAVIGSRLALLSTAGDFSARTTEALNPLEAVTVTAAAGAAPEPALLHAVYDEIASRYERRGDEAAGGWSDAFLALITPYRVEALL